MRRSCSKSMTEEVLEILCGMRLNSTDSWEQFLSLDPFQKVFDAQVSKTVSCVNMEQMMVRVSTIRRKDEQHTVYLQDHYKAIRAQMRLAQDHQVLTIPLLENSDNLGQIQETSESWSHLINTLFAKTVLPCARIPELESADPCAV